MRTMSANITAGQRTKWLGLALMFYPYVVWNTWLLYLVGIALCIGAWTDRRLTAPPPGAGATAASSRPRRTPHAAAC